jgi:hypothetical protein
MFSKAVILAALFATQALGRERWLERNGRAVRFHPRRFGQEHPEVINKLSAACDGGVCGNLAGQAITPLLAAQPECSQQDMADAIIGECLPYTEVPKDGAEGPCRCGPAVRRHDEGEHDRTGDWVSPGREEHATGSSAHAFSLSHCLTSTLQDFSVQPNINRNSVFCTKAPKHSELNGLVQAQDPANDPNVFFDRMPIYSVLHAYNLTGFW